MHYPGIAPLHFHVDFWKEAYIQNVQGEVCFGGIVAMLLKTPQDHKKYVVRLNIFQCS